jgi:hypothetical protein
MALPIEAELEKMERMVRILEIVITFFRYLPVVIGVMATISLIQAALNFWAASYGWAIFNLILGVLGVIFVIRASRPNPRHFEYNSEIAH